MNICSDNRRVTHSRHVNTIIARVTCVLQDFRVYFWYAPSLTGGAAIDIWCSFISLDFNDFPPTATYGFSTIIFCDVLEHRDCVSHIFHAMVRRHHGFTTVHQAVVIGVSRVSGVRCSTFIIRPWSRDHVRVSNLGDFLHADVAVWIDVQINCYHSTGAEKHVLIRDARWHLFHFLVLHVVGESFL